jgi:type IV secretory pathway VirB9-like protein
MNYGDLEQAVQGEVEPSTPLKVVVDGTEVNIDSVELVATDNAYHNDTDRDEGLDIHHVELRCTSNPGSISNSAAANEELKDVKSGDTQ